MELTVIEFVNIDHIAQAVSDADKQVQFLTDVLGFRVVDGGYVDDNFRTVMLAIPGTSKIGWEVMEPIGPSSYLHRFLEGVRGPGMHHLSMRVESLEEARISIRALDIEPWGNEKDSTYIHPAQGGQGFLYQFFEGANWYKAEVFEDESDHTLGIIAVNHIAHACSDRDELGTWYKRTMGYETFWRAPDNLQRDFQTCVLEAPTKQMRIETIAPVGEESFVRRFLDQRGTGVHHLTVEVADWNRAVGALAHHDVHSFAEREGTTEGVLWREAFIHPKQTGGVLLQYFWQAKPGYWI